MDETETDDFGDAVADWCKRADEEIRLKKARQEFVNRMVECLIKIRAFQGHQDEHELTNIAELAVRLAHTCYKQDGTGPVRGYGIKHKFVDAVHKYKHETDLKEIRADVNRRKRIKALREENKELKRRLKELEG